MERCPAYTAPPPRKDRSTDESPHEADENHALLDTVPAMIDSPFTLIVPGSGTEPLRVLEFEVVERLSKPYKVDLVCEAPLDVDPTTLVGQHALLGVAVLRRDPVVGHAASGA